MKKTLLQLLVLSTSLLQARELPNMGKSARIASEDLKLDSLSTFGWNMDTQGYDSVSYVYHEWDAHLKAPVGTDITIIKKGKRINFRKSEVSVAKYADSTVYTILTKKWQVSTKAWITYSKDKFAVHHSPLSSTNIKYLWDDISNDWELAGKTIKHFDANGNQTINEIHNWNTFIKKWYPEEKTDITYNEHGQMTSKTKYYDIFRSMEWQLADKDVYIFDANGRKLIDSLYYTPDDTIRLFGTNQYFYDAKGRLLTEKIYNRSLTDTIVLNKTREYTYPDSNANAVIVVESVRDADSLKLDIRYTRIYDSGKKLMSVTEENWNTTEKIWEPWEKTVYFDNEIGKPSFVNYYWDYSDLDWTRIESFEKYHYSTMTVDIKEEVLETKALFYPNPAKDHIILNVTADVQYSVYNAQGQILLVGNGKEMDLSSLDGGTYLLRINDQGKMASQKIVKY